jgi:cytoskeletal protein CcmA (bactofilin family)
LIEGDIGVEGAITIGEAGRVLGPIRASEVVVAGKHRGDVNAQGVRVTERGCLEGDVFAEQIALDDGGLLQGIVQMSFDLPNPREVL